MIMTQSKESETKKTKGAFTEGKSKKSLKEAEKKDIVIGLLKGLNIGFLLAEKKFLEKLITKGIKKSDALSLIDMPEEHYNTIDSQIDVFLSLLYLNKSKKRTEPLRN
jgi:hypothetical protein